MDVGSYAMPMRLMKTTPMVLDEAYQIVIDFQQKGVSYS